MPYISKEETKAIRNEIKAAFPGYKFSISMSNNMALKISVLSGPIELISNPTENLSRNENINEYYYEEHYANEPEKLEFLKKLVAIAYRNVATVTHDVDYGAIPNYYVNLSIGSWDRPYEVKN
jgi:hypothetical protein